MATFRITFVTARPKTSKGIQTTDSHSALNNVSNLVAAMNIGASDVRPGSVVTWIDDNATAASGTVTCLTVANNSTVQVGGITFTGKTASPTGLLQFLCGVSGTADGAALAAIINAHPTASLYVKAVSVAGVVTVTAIGSAIGLLGNGLILSSSDGTNLAVVAMASGVDDPGKATYNF